MDSLLRVEKHDDLASGSSAYRGVVPLGRLPPWAGCVFKHLQLGAAPHTLWTFGGLRRQIPSLWGLPPETSAYRGRAPKRLHRLGF